MAPEPLPCLLPLPCLQATICAAGPLSSGAIYSPDRALQNVLPAGSVLPTIGNTTGQEAGNFAGCDPGNRWLWSSRAQRRRWSLQALPRLHALPRWQGSKTC